MYQIKKKYVHIFLLFCLTISLVSVFPSPALSYHSTNSPAIGLNDCAVDTVKDAIPQAEGAYVANSNTGKFHYAGCRYVAKMSPEHKVYFDTREEAAGAGYVACKVCRP